MKKAPPWTSSLAATKPWLWWVPCTIFGGHWAAPYKLCLARARVQIGWWQTSAAGRYSRPWPWHSPAGPVAIHCAAGSPFVTVSQLTSPPEHPQFSVFPHEKIHGNLKTKPCFSTTMIIEESKEPKLSFPPSLLNCFPMEYKFAGHFSKKIEKHQFISSSFTSNLYDMAVNKTH